MYHGELFDIDEGSRDYMFTILPPLFIHGNLFAMRKYLTSSITSIIFQLSLNGTMRHFHAYFALFEQGVLDRERDLITRI